MLACLGAKLLNFGTDSFLGLLTLTVKQATTSPPTNFPNGIEIHLGTYTNWAREHTVKNIWIASPSNASQVLTIANWAVIYGYKLRAKGAMHGWSPLVINETDSKKDITVLIDTTMYLTAISLNSNTNIVTAEVGVTLEALLSYLE